MKIYTGIGIFILSLGLVILYLSKSEKKLKVFILAGQSNMEGRADANKLLDKDLERLLKVKNKVQLAYNGEPVGQLRFVKPSEEIAEIYNRDMIFGPELFFGITLSESWMDEKILLIKLTEGGTSLYGAWNPEWDSEKAALMGEEGESKLYHNLIKYIDQSLSSYTKDEYEICAMLWVQGETDAGNKIAAEAYGENLQNLIIHIRKDLENNSLPFVFFQVGHGKVVEGMIKTAELLPNVTLIHQSLDPESLNFYPKMENGHYNYKGMKKLGERFAEIILEMAIK